jgi:hypothetical protein
MFGKGLQVYVACCRKGNKEDWRGKGETTRVAISERIEGKS